MRELTIVIPVFNEAGNFPALWREVTEQVRAPFSAIIVYDFDEDDTVPVVREMISGGESRLRLEKNRLGRGVVAAIRTGFEMVPEGPVLVLMADLSDDLRQVDVMLERYGQGFDLVVGSRYMRGGRLIGGPWLKRNLSRMAGLSLHWLRGLPTHDATNAFKIYDRAMIKSFTIESSAGFELNLELTVKAFLGGYRIAEVPSTWRDRTAGQSRFRLWKWLRHYLRWYFYAFRGRSSAQPPRESRESAESA